MIYSIVIHMKLSNRILIGFHQKHYALTNEKKLWQGTVLYTFYFIHKGIVDIHSCMHACIHIYIHYIHRYIYILTYLDTYIRAYI